ncbi:MAG TPA: 2-C-methyl-D-erythritol 4-phosphate cytidylyltransferase [Solirubrobacterales bacterium]
MGVTAVIAAAGSGERLGAGGPKAFVPLAGRPMIEWSLDALREAGAAAIVVARPPGHDYESAGEEPHGSDPALAPAPIQVVDGGATRAESVANALAVVETELVAIHDAARPLLTADLLRGVVATLEADPDAAGAIAATPLTDTIKRAARPSRRFDPSEGPNRRLGVEETVDREELWAAQTPQVFRTVALREALATFGQGSDAVAAQASEVTDEAMLIERAGGQVLIHPAPQENLKVTTPLDLLIAERLLAERSAK